MEVFLILNSEILTGFVMRDFFKVCVGAVALIVAACSTEQPDGMDIEIPGDASVSELRIDVAGGEAVISFEATAEWTAEVIIGSWFSVSPASGSAGHGSVTVKAEPFDVYSTASASRIGFVTFRCGSYAKSVAVVQSDPQAAEDKDNAEAMKVRRRGGEISVSVPSHAIGYNVEISEPWISVVEKKTGSLKLRISENLTAESRRSSVKVMSAGGDAEIVNVSVEQSWRDIEPGEMLIEEVFFTGSPLPSTGVPNGKNKDQYFRLTNNTDEVLYADRLLIIESKNANAGQTWKEFKNPIINEYCEAGTVMCVPGGGADVPVAPGESLIIASNGINYREGYSASDPTMKVEMNPDGIDLSVADFEWYTQSTNSVIDIDVPEVPNMDMWFCYTLSILNLHDRGFQSYAIAQPPVTVGKEEFMAGYNWAGAEYISHTLAGDFDMTLDKVYKVPNSWVIDAVMCTVPSINQTRQFSETLDSGWTWASPQNIDKDSRRYGLSVRRNRAADGRLIDTNNSLTDFTPNATPSIRQK